MEIERRLQEIMERLFDSQEKMNAKIEARRERMEAEMHCIRSDLERTIKRQMENLLSRLDYKNQSLHKHMTEVIVKSPVELETVVQPFDRRMMKVQEELTNVNSGLVTDFNEEHMDTQANRKKSLARIEATRREFQSQPEDVNARGEHGRGTQNGTRAVKLTKFDGTYSWTVFRCQFETEDEHNSWTSQEKSTHSIITLQGRPTDVLHGIPKWAIYEKTLQTLGGTFRRPKFRASLIAVN
jgi:hypothetical protein